VEVETDQLDHVKIQRGECSAMLTYLKYQEHAKGNSDEEKLAYKKVLEVST
jgi:hypothetical protein